MASILSLPRLPFASPASSSASRFSAPHQGGACTSRLSIWSRETSERNVGVEACSSDNEQASSSGRDGVEAAPGRREVVLAAALAVFGTSAAAAVARDRRNRKEIAPSDYLTSGTGVKYFDVEEGKGALVGKGETVMVHFDCVYRSITVVSSRESKLLAGNRTIAEPYELTVGAVPGRERKRDFVDNANGLFSAQAAPKPPPALYSITEGMRVGGKRTVIVPPELGYGERGINEIPPGATFDLNIELLEVKKPQNEKSK